MSDLANVQPAPSLQPVATPRHFPADPNRFVFDASVAAIFDNMALRSIPGYGGYFERVSEIVSRKRLPKYSQVWDMGVSTGAGLDAVKRATFHPFVEYFGIDISEPMLAKASERCPYATMQVHDLEKGLPDVEIGNVSVFLWSWTLQFLPSKELRRELLLKSAEALHPEGCIFIGEKFVNSDPVLQEVLEDGYYKFRLENGYTIAEIKAKSKALEGSMWPWTHEELLETAETAGLRARPLYRHFNFGGYVLSR
jgi:tRNA (cmo5U34)-methyltransferase